MEAAPPVPPGGIPVGWTMEQWNHYGHQWLAENPTQVQPNPVINNLPNPTMNQSPQFLVSPIQPMYTTKRTSNSITIIFVVLGVFVLVGLISLVSGVLYVWANSLTAEEDTGIEELYGTWYNPADTLILYPNGTVSESTDTLRIYSVNGDTISFTWDDNFTADAIYDIESDSDGDLILFIAFYVIDENGTKGDEIDGANCVAYSNSIEGSGNNGFEDKKAIFPYWCDPVDETNENDNP